MFLDHENVLVAIFIKLFIKNVILFLEDNNSEFFNSKINYQYVSYR